MYKHLLMVFVGVAGTLALVTLRALASASKGEQEGYWATNYFDDPCYWACTSHLPFCTCYGLPPIIAH